MKLVSVKFLYPIVPKPYVFAAYEELVVGDLVVVDTVKGFQLATVVEIDVVIPSHITPEIVKQVVSRVDTTRYEAQMKKNAEIRDMKQQIKNRIEPIIDSIVDELMN